MTIHVYHPYRQPDGTNHCQAVNGHCSHLCLPAPQINSRSPKISCACPTGLKLMDDGLMCVEDGKFEANCFFYGAPSFFMAHHPTPAMTATVNEIFPPLVGKFIAFSCFIAFKFPFFEFIYILRSFFLPFSSVYLSVKQNNHAAAKIIPNIIDVPFFHTVCMRTRFIILRAGNECNKKINQ